MNCKKLISEHGTKLLLSLSLGGMILYWMYRNFDFAQIRTIMLHQMDWTWMWLSFPFGISAQLFRGLRWNQVLTPVGEKARTGIAIHSIFLSYAVSVFIPRLGEFSRCAVLKRYDAVSFSKALGTVFTERIVDSALVLLITGITLLLQVQVFDTFFLRTGTTLDSIFARFSSTGWIVTFICAIAALAFGIAIMRRISLHSKLKSTMQNMMQGVASLRQVNNVPLYICYTLGIWLSYFLHYYLTFFCFAETARLGLDCAVVSFVVGSIAVVVPTPNGAGPWHFAVKTMLILYGVSEMTALNFVIIVHTIQTLLILVLGLWAGAVLGFSKVKKQQNSIV